MSLSVEPSVGTNPTLRESLFGNGDIESHRDINDPWRIGTPDVWMQHRIPVVTTIGTAASGAIWVDPRSFLPTSASSDAVRLEDQPREELPWQMSSPEERWMHLKWRHFKRNGRQERIEAALAALEEAVMDYGLDNDTVRWIAEGADLEDM